MSFDKAIKHGKEHRKPYYKKPQRDDASCRPGGNCPHCIHNRTFTRRLKKNDDIQEQNHDS